MNVVKKAGSAETVWLRKENQGCSQAGWPLPASEIIRPRESDTPGWNFRRSSMPHTIRR